MYSLLILTFQKYSKLLLSKIEIRDDMELVLRPKTQIICDCDNKDIKTEL